ncbi:hypothetical protein [Staphylospora marina]|uniref:hypothetical protein n=1 Tax=Staphylospora marina TaxID=2490858 RepID=UPI000F5B9D32|nr:hypothetical protein [Staphylospora marina]
MFKKFLGTIGILLISGFLVTSLSMTRELKKIDEDMEQNIDLLQELILIQDRMISNSGELPGINRTLTEMEESLDRTSTHAEESLTLLSEILDKHTDNLALNVQLAHSSALSGRRLHEVKTALEDMSPHLNQLEQLLSRLASVSDRERQHLERILAAARNMNRKTPEVNLP